MNTGRKEKPRRERKTMETIKALAEELRECSEYIKRLEQMEERGGVSETFFDQLAKQRTRKNDIMDKIEALRHGPYRHGVTYATRATFSGPTDDGNIEKLRKNAAFYRFCMRCADKAMQEGRSQDAEKMRQRAEEARAKMDEIRKAGTRTITTPAHSAQLKAHFAKR